MIAAVKNDGDSQALFLMQHPMPRESFAESLPLLIIVAVFLMFKTFRSSK